MSVMLGVTGRTEKSASTSSLSIKHSTADMPPLRGHARVNIGYESQMIMWNKDEEEGNELLSHFKILYYYLVLLIIP